MISYLLAGQDGNSMSARQPEQPPSLLCLRQSYAGGSNGGRVSCGRQQDGLPKAAQDPPGKGERGFGRLSALGSKS